MSELPDKLYFKIGEVAKLVGVKPYVLRYWETEFPSIRPGKTESKHRLYRRRDVETLLEIRRLLHDERYTIEGAKRRLRGSGGPSAAEEDVVDLVEVAQDGDTDGADGRQSEGAGAVDDSQMSLPLGESRYRKELLAMKRELEEIHGLLRD